VSRSSAELLMEPGGDGPRNAAANDTVTAQPVSMSAKRCGLEDDVGTQTYSWRALRSRRVEEPHNGLSWL
jgi:hypothetical protein